MWGYRHAGDTRLVNVHVQRLRSKIEHDPEQPEIIVTVRGVGYRAGDIRSRPDEAGWARFARVPARWAALAAVPGRGAAPSRQLS